MNFTILEQVLIVFAIVNILFGFYEYKARNDLVVVFTKLFQPKYLIASISISIFYLILTIGILPLLRRILT